MLLGPFALEDIALQIESGYPGVYILSRNGKTAAYVGRSDNDIGARIHHSSLEGFGYRWFWFEYATSPHDAYIKECWYYHRYSASLDNQNHPAVPPRTYWRCPVEGCPWS